VRVVFVDNLLYEGTASAPVFDLQPHLGLLSLVAVARGAGVDAQVYDPKLALTRGELALDASLYSAMAEQIAARGPDVVGFTALGCNMHCVVNVARRLKQIDLALPVLLGGPHATILHREIVNRFPQFDFVVRGEAEETLLPLLARVHERDFGELTGVSYRGAAGELVCGAASPIVQDLDGLPVPAYDCYPIGELGLETIRVEAGRGCPFSCTFCSTASFFGRSYRLKSVARLLAEMDHLHRTYGFSDFKLNHDLFTVNRTKVRAFCEALFDRTYTWGCSARTDCVDPELLSTMARAGCRSIYFGIEAGSERMQRRSRKRLDLAEVEPVLDACDANGIRSTASFIIGYPDEERADQDATLEMAGRLWCRPGARTTSQIHLLTPEPGTQLIEEHHAALRFDGYVTDFNFPRLHPDDGALLAAEPAIFANHQHFATVLPRARNVFVASAWIALCTLGRPAAVCALRAFGGSLAHFMREAYEWYGERAVTADGASASDLIAFLTARFGARHQLVSLFRYAHASNAICAAREPNAPPLLGAHGDPRDVALRLSARAAVLEDVHDCVALLRRFEHGEAEPLTSSDGPLTTLLLVCTPAAGKKIVATYAIGTATAGVLRAFERPASYWEYGAAAARCTEPFADWNGVASLVELGALVCELPRRTLVAAG